MKNKELLKNNPEALLKAMEKKHKEISKSSASVKRFLAKTGVYDASGNLVPSYK